LALLLVILLSAPDAVFLRHFVTADVSDPDSGYLETTSEIIIPLTARGVSRYSEISSSYRAGWESLYISASVAHWRSGRGEEEAEISEEPHSSLLSSGRLESSLREVKVYFPGLEIGDTIFVEIERHISTLPLDDLYSYGFYAASRDSIHSSRFDVIHSPSDELMWITAESGEESSWSTGDGTQRLRWTFGPGSPVDDLPFSAPVEYTRPSVSIALASPEEVSRRLYRVLVESCMYEDPGPADSIISATGGEPLAVSAWIADEIDYIGSDWGDYPGYSPRLPGETLRDRAGVCRDRAVLLIWLLGNAGYRPFAILTSISGNVGPLVGSRSFDHMLVGLEDQSGDTVYLDPTNAYIPAGFTYTLRGRGYLPLTETGSPLKTFPEMDSDDRISITINGNADLENGMISGEIRVDFSGSASELFRSMFNSVSDSNVGLLLQRLFGTLPGCVLSVTGDPADASSTVAVTGHGQWHIDVLRGSFGTAFIIPGINDIDIVGSRASALLLPGFRDQIMIETPYAAELTMRLGLPDHRDAALPESVEKPGYVLSVGLEGDSLVIHEQLCLLPLLPSAEELEAVRTAAMTALSGWNRAVILR
jgi:hypothetical protein